MANETEVSNIAHRTDEISDAISAALVQSVVCAPLIYSENLPSGTLVKLWRKDGSLTAEGVAESAAYSFSASSELTQATVSSTATKFAVVSKLTVEAQQVGLDVGKIAQEQGAAIARVIDDEILALNAGFGTSVTCTTIATIDKLFDAVYTIQNALAGGSRQLVAWLGYKAVNNLRKEIFTGGNAVFTQPSQTTLLRGIASPNGFVGSVPGADLYVTNGHPTGGGDDVQLVFNPDIAFGMMASPSVTVQTLPVLSGGFWVEIASHILMDVIEWNDGAGCGYKSDT